jgi:hypothetical protein
VVETFPDLPVAEKARLADRGERRVFRKRIYESAWSRDFPEVPPPDSPWPFGLE